LGTSISDDKGMPDAPYFVDDQAVVEENNSYVPNYFDFKSYRMWANKPFEGKYLNVDENGVRLNGAPSRNVSQARKIEIWALGSSELFGIPASKDNQTLPANIERKLNGKYPDIEFSVINHSVIAYRTLQQSILYKFLLLNSKPDLVFVFDGANDVIQAARMTDIESDTMTQRPLQYYWDQHLNGNIVNWGVLAHMLKKSLADAAFRNSRQVVAIIGRNLRAKNKEGGIEAWRKEYLAKSRAVREPFLKSAGQGLDLFRFSIQEIIQLSRKFNIPVVLAQQPHIMMTKKTLVGREIENVYNSFGTNYAIPEDRLAKIKSVPPNIPNAYIPLDLMRQTYAKQNAILAELAQANGVGYVNIEPIIDGLDGKPVFWDSVHLTPFAHDVVSGKLADEIASLLGLQK